MLTDDERKQALQSLETEDEKKAREAKEADDANKPKRGRPPGTSNKPKLSEEALRAGCVSLVVTVWVLSSIPTRLAGAVLDDLTDAEKAEGAMHMEALVRRYGWMVLLITVVGFPLWFGRMFAQKIRRKPQLATVSEISAKPSAKA